MLKNYSTLQDCERCIGWSVLKDISVLLVLFLLCFTDSAFIRAAFTSSLHHKPMTTATTGHRLTSTYQSVKLLISFCLTKGVYQDVTATCLKHFNQPVTITLQNKCLGSHKSRKYLCSWDIFASQPNTYFKFVFMSFLVSLKEPSPVWDLWMSTHLSDLFSI